MVRVCALNNCTNSEYRLERWKKTMCPVHQCLHMDAECNCEPPFKLFTFPAEHKNEWTRIVYRKDERTGKNWKPTKNSRICSEHFIDGKPTAENPYPTLKLGFEAAYYVNTPKARKRPAARNNVTSVISSKKLKVESKNDASECSSSSTSIDTSLHFHSTYTKNEPPECKECNEKDHVIKEVTEKYLELSDTSMSNQKPVPATTNVKVGKTLRFLKTNSKVRTFTGLRSRQAFEDLFFLVHKKASTMRYWRGNKRLQSKNRTYLRTPRKHGPARKLTMKEELLLVLLKLKQNLSNNMLSVTFGVSSMVISSIFSTWIKLLAMELKPLIYWPSKDRVFQTFPKSLPQKGDYRHLRATIDCTEIFIERPRDLQLQALTWSDYKHHNTVKLFVAIAPNGMVSFLPPAWGGRASDQYVTRHCGFLDLLEPMDVILADRGFPIQEDLLLQGARLIIPPPAAGLDQMSRLNVKKTSQVANARIHVERAIGQMKYFEILNSTLPLTMVPLIDDIATVCAALSNLRPSLVL